MARVDPAVGENPLSDQQIIDQFGNNDLSSYLRQSFLTNFGRNPTAQEAAQAFPAFQGTDPNKPNIGAGNALIAQMSQALSQTPDKIYSAQQEKYRAEAPKHSETINQLFQSTFGRAADQDELTHFGGLIASGTTDPYQLKQFLQQQSEYTTKQDADFRKGMASELEGYDKQYFQEQVMPGIQQNFAKQGRSFDSSGFSNSLAQAAGAQNMDRQKYIANLSASQYAGRQGNARSDYESYVNQQQNLTNMGLQAGYQNIQGARTRANEISDYNTQMNAYNQYLARYGKRNNNQGIGALAGGILGAGIGAYAGGGNPQAISTGYTVGSGVGGGIGSQT